MSHKHKNIFNFKKMYRISNYAHNVYKFGENINKKKYFTWKDFIIAYFLRYLSPDFY